MIKLRKKKQIPRVKNIELLVNNLNLSEMEAWKLVSLRNKTTLIIIIAIYRGFNTRSLITLFTRLKYASVPVVLLRLFKIGILTRRFVGKRYIYRL